MTFFFSKLPAFFFSSSHLGQKIARHFNELLGLLSAVVGGWTKWEGDADQVWQKKCRRRENKAGVHPHLASGPDVRADAASKKSGPIDEYAAGAFLRRDPRYRVEQQLGLWDSAAAGEGRRCCFALSHSSVLALHEDSSVGARFNGKMEMVTVDDALQTPPWILAAAPCVTSAQSSTL